MTDATGSLFSFFTALPDEATVVTETLRSARGGAAHDLEIDLTATPVTRIKDVLDGLRLAGRPAHSARIELKLDTLSQACAAVTAGGAIPVLRGGVPDAETAAAIRAAANGRLIYSTPFSKPDGGRLMAIIESLR